MIVSFFQCSFTFWIVALMIATSGVAAETGTIHGTVTDRETKKALAGASVLLIPRDKMFAEELTDAYGRNQATLQQLTGEMAQSEQRAGAIVQQDGSFVIKNVKVGNYTLSGHIVIFPYHKGSVIQTRI
ncbi:MAG: carboxypeptidase regulatory-like domain-containing protein [Ignavibacteria bacterium]|nr:carboxypeptidase regulatory-like domain-containing protein [Ignavibacteria bacterium]